jgi:hypothetical protein
MAPSAVQAAHGEDMPLAMEIFVIPDPDVLIFPECRHFRSDMVMFTAHFRFRFELFYF